MSLACVGGFHRWPVNSPHKGPVTRKMFPFDDVITFDPYIWERVVLSCWASVQQPSTPPHPHPHPNCFSTIEISGNAKGVNFKCHLNIRKHRPWAYILGFIELPYFGPWTVSADIFGWTYLYLYLNRRICICICIWIKVEEKICICIWKIQIFVFVFDKTYLTPALAMALFMFLISGTNHMFLVWLLVKTAYCIWFKPRFNMKPWYMFA